MKKVVMILLIVPVLSCSEKKKEIRTAVVENENYVPKNEKITISKLNGIYEYIYEHNTEDFIENHYLEFKNDESIYYGTSDDFDEEREGYLPGFFKVKMNNFNQKDDSIKFYLMVDDSIFYKKTLTPLNQFDGNELWGISIGTHKKQYKGKINGDTIVVTPQNLDSRVFVKIKE